MSYYCRTDRFTTRSGDALPGYKVRALTLAGVVAPIYLDQSGTPATDNMVEQDSNGNHSFFIDYGIYQVECLHPITLERIIHIPYANMDGNDASLRTDISSPTGGSLVAYALSYSGAVTRTLADKLNEMVSVKDFGATGDGVTNDAAAIQAALDSGADHIWVPDGNYKISTALTVNSGTTIEGPGAAARITTTGTNKRLFVISGKTDVIIRGLFIEGNLTSQGNPTVDGADGGDGVLIRNSQRVRVEGCTFKDIGLTTYTGSSCGIDIYISTDVEIHGNIFTGTGKSSVGADIGFAYYCRRVKITDNWSTSEQNAFASGPAVGVNPTDNLHHVITGNIASRLDSSTARSGIIASYASMPAYVLIANNIMENWPSNGIYVSAATIGTGETAGIVISGNVIRYCGGNDQMPGIESGMYLSGRAGLTCVGNIVAFSGYKSDGSARTDPIAGILISGSARAINVACNTVIGGQGRGINIRNSTNLLQETISITSNTLLDNVGGAILIDPSQVGGIQRDIRISNNILTGTGVDAHGIEVSLSDGAAPPLRLAISNNTITGKLSASTKDGIKVNCGTMPGWSIRGNDISLWANGANFTNGGLPDKEIGFVCALDGNTFTSNTTAIVVPNIDAGQYMLAFDNVFVSNGTNASPAGYVLLGTRLGPRTFRVRRATPPPDGAWEEGQITDFTAPAQGGRTSSYCRVAGSPGTWDEINQMHHTGSKTYDWPSLATAAQQTTTVSVANASLGDFVEVSMSLDMQGLNMWGYVSAAGVVTVVLRNDTGGTIDLASGTLRARLVKA